MSCLVLIGAMLGACTGRGTVVPTQTPVRPSATPQAPTPTRVTPTATRPAASPAPTATTAPSAAPENTPTPTLVPQPLGYCPLGTGLREETAALLTGQGGNFGLLMVASSRMAETYFPQLEGSLRVLGAPSLETMRQKAARARQNGVDYEALGYGLETSASTPDGEWGDLIGSTQQARAIADEYGKLLVMGPGFRLMSQNEDQYPAMAALADIWVFQTQRLQIHPPGPEYRQEVERIVRLIRSGNPDIIIWAQITFLPDREPDPAEWLSYRDSIADLVDGTYMGAYTWDSAHTGQIIDAMRQVMTTVCRSE